MTGPLVSEIFISGCHSVLFYVFAEYTALSNMPVSKSAVLSDGWVKDEFKPTPIMSTYLLAFVVADFRSRERATDSGLTVRYISMQYQTCPLCSHMVTVS